MTGRSAERAAAKPDAGFVLVSALLLLATLSLVALAVTTSTSLNIKAAANIARAAEAQALADGLTRLVAWRQAQPGRPPLRGALACVEDGADVGITIIDVAGLVDLNAAPAIVLARLLAGLGEAPDAAQRLAARIIDFRDADDDVQEGGAEREEYRTAGLPHGPKNAPFELVGELDQVLGLSPDLLDRLRPFVTVHSYRNVVDLNAAPEPLRALLDPDGRSSLRTPPAFTRASAITVHVAQPGGARFTRASVIELVAGSRLGFVFRDWTSARAAQTALLRGSSDCVSAIIAQ